MIQYWKEQPAGWFWGHNFQRELPLIPYVPPKGCRIELTGDILAYTAEDKYCSRCGGPLVEVYYGEIHDTKTGQLVVTVRRRCGRASMQTPTTYSCPATTKDLGGCDY
jgi:ribosomal protein L37E